MTAQLTFNPYVTSNATGSFNATSAGYIQGLALDDPAIRNELAGGILASTETLPMWGGVGISELIPGLAGNPSPVLGGSIGRATTLTAQATGQLTGFSVFNQNHSAVNSPQSPVPLTGSGGQVNFYRLGSGIRIPVAIDTSLVSLEGGLITQLVSWDFVNQRLIPYSVTYPATTITGAAWANTAGGQTTFTVSTDLTADINAGDDINVSGVVSTGGTGVGFNGAFTVVSITSTTIVVTQVAASSPGSYSSGGTVAAGGGALPVKIVGVEIGNSMTVSFNATTGFATWNRSGSTAVIIL